MIKTILRKEVLLILLLCFCCGCITQKEPSIQPTEGESTEEMPEGTTESSVGSSEEQGAEEKHSELYMPTVSVEDVIRYFNEVCLDAEFVNGGDPSKIQKWTDPILYICHGTYTDKDKEVLDGFAAWLNTVEGFPGMQETQDQWLANLNIYFCEEDEYITLMGENFYGTDGGVTFWYNGADEIYTAVIGYRTDIDQQVRNSVILEEIYNGLGPINDTQLRLNSVIYSGFSTPQSLSEEDKLIMKLLYHPQIQCGMDAEECEAVIRQLYY